jgi:hypothetical protein
VIRSRESAAVPARTNQPGAKSRASRLVRAWAPLSAAAFVFSLTHALIDWHIGVFGPSSETLAAVPAALVWLAGVTYGWWTWCLLQAAAGSRSHLIGAVVLNVGWAFAGNGLPIFVCLPPCLAAFPHQDVAHMGSLIFGALAGYAGLRTAAMHPGPVQWRIGGISAGLVVAGFILQTVASAAVA